MFPFICSRSEGNKREVYVIKENLCLDKLSEIKVVKLSFPFSFHISFATESARVAVLHPRCINLQMIRTVGKWKEFGCYSERNIEKFPWRLPDENYSIRKRKLGKIVLKTWNARAFFTCRKGGKKQQTLKHNFHESFRAVGGKIWISEMVTTE